jgi:hypothetical protein
LSSKDYISLYPKMKLSGSGGKAMALWGVEGKIQTAIASLSGGAATWGTYDNIPLAAYSHDYRPNLGLSYDGSNATVISGVREIYFSGYSGDIHATSANIAGNSAVWGTAVKISEQRGN